MDWIERWFGIAPDNGDGSFELSLMLTVAAVVIALAIWHYPPGRAALLRVFTRLRLGLKARRRL
jgi:hypothetical protein